MENRLKRLEDEESKANRNKQMAEKKAAKMLEARGRHYNDLMRKIKHIDDQNNQLEL